MSVWCKQSIDGVAEDPYVIAPHSEAQSDDELLAAKAAGAADKGWAVEWTGERSFTAMKDRWGSIPCVREFWIE